MKFVKTYEIILALSVTIFLVFYRVFLATDEEIRARLRISKEIEKIDFSAPILSKVVNIVSHPKNVCQNQAQEVDIVCYVMVQHDDFQIRQVIRNTWGRRAKFPYVDVFFVLGKSRNEDTNRQIMEENEKFGDLLVSDFLDTYRNLSFKSITAWKWMSQNCQRAKLYLKANDGLLVNFDSIKASLNENKFQKNSFFCQVEFDKQVEREKSSLYYTSYSEYPREVYPKYCKNQGVIFYSDLLPKLYEESIKYRNFWIDDINTGIIASRLNASYQISYGKHINFELFEESKKNFGNFFFIYGLGGSKNVNESWNRVLRT